MTRENGFIHVRYRPPSQFETIRTPEWAANVAASVAEGTKVRMGKTPAGNWFVQSVLVPRKRGRSKNNATRVAGKVRRKIAN